MKPFGKVKFEILFKQKLSAFENMLNFGVNMNISGY